MSQDSPVPRKGGYQRGTASSPTRLCTRCGVDRRIPYAHRNRPDPYVCRFCRPPAGGRPTYSPEYRRNSALRSRYGITTEQYDEMLAEQAGVCAICGNPPKKRRLYVDHDHDTGRVRGLLCAHCNSSLEWMIQNYAWATMYLGGDWSASRYVPGLTKP